jgi:hypothetical protein
MRPRFWLLLLAAGCWFLAERTCKVNAQGTTVPRVRDSNVGYIDPAIPGNLIRLRLDSADDNIRPTLAESFWSPGGVFGDGPSIPESSVDYQDVGMYLESLLTPSVSAFVEAPVRLLDPQQNPNTAGMSDMNVGLKAALIDHENLVATFQFRTYVPTADVDRGLGNGHVSLEPALLVYMPLSERWSFEGELRDWIPVDGTDFAGNILRYGAGLHYDLVGCETWQLAPVAEFVGWSILDGSVAIRQPDGSAIVESAAGDTIVNAKLGVRLRLGEQMDVYTGYGRPLTGDQWYESIYRLELRFFF